MSQTRKDTKWFWWLQKWFWWFWWLGIACYKYFPYIRTAFIKFGFAVNSPALVVWGFFMSWGLRIFAKKHYAIQRLNSVRVRNRWHPDTQPD